MTSKPDPVFPRIAPWFVFVTALCIASVQTAFANSDTTFVVRTFSVVTSTAPPPWAGGKNFRNSVEMYRDQIRTQRGTEFFIVEFIPKGESFENWSKLYAIAAEIAIDRPAQTPC